MAQVTGWVEDSTGWKYYIGKSTYLKNCWKMIDGKRYAFDKEDFMK